MGKAIVAVYPGSFDPITNGHLDILRRALKIFDGVSIALLENTEKEPLFSTEDRTELIRECTKGMNVVVESFSGLLADYMKTKDTDIIVRSLRTTSDFDYEFQMSVMNSSLNPGMESVFLMSDKEHFFLSSSAVKEVARLHGDVSHMVPPAVAKRLQERFS